MADPYAHNAVNVALYGPGGRWCMTERGAGALRRSEQVLRIGPSELVWARDRLTIHLDEWTAPWPRRLRGQIQLQSPAFAPRTHTLDAAGLHRWHPYAPCAHIEVDLDHPRLRWQGTAYVDGNTGDRPLEADFQRWDWARAHLPGGRTAVLYDVIRRDGEPASLSLDFSPHGQTRNMPPPPASPLPGTRWGIARGGRSEPASPAQVLRTLEDTPFYARSMLRTRWLDEDVTAMHESLNLQRFDSPWVRLLLPFRMPRRAA